MSTIVWDAVGEKRYEAGIDRGVLYIQSELYQLKGVAWNGLLGVDDENTDEVTPVHIDGFKIRNLVSVGDFSATLRAYTYPDEFLACEGFRLYQGMIIDDQSQMEFSLTFRTHVGNDVDGQESSYKIHLLYNLTAVADTKSYTTFSLSPEPLEFSWSLSSRPEEAVGYRPAAHFIIDSRLWDPEKLASFEDILYGTPYAPPALPPFKDMLEILNPKNLLVILVYQNGEWAAIDLTNEHLSFYGPEIFELTAPTVVMADAETFDASTYTLLY